MKTAKKCKYVGNGSKRDWIITGAYLLVSLAVYQAAIVQSWFCGGAA